MTHYTIRCIGFDQQQTNSFSAVFDLANSALTNSWRFTETEDSDIILINMDSDEGKRMFFQQKDVIPNHRLILSAEYCENSMHGYWFLTKKQSGPPSLRELTTVFNQAGMVLSQAIQTQATAIEAGPAQEPKNPVTSEQSDTPAIKELKKLLPKNYLFGLILQAEKDGVDRVVKLKQRPTLFISPNNNAYSFAGTTTELNALCTAPLKQLKIKRISQNKLLKDENKAINLDKKPLAALKARSVIQASQGRILEGHTPELIVKLRQLPDFDTLPVLEKYRNIAVYMSDTANNLFTVAESLHVPLADVFDFYNVCHIFGMVEINDDRTHLPQAYENNNSRVLAQFLKSLFKRS